MRLSSPRIMSSKQRPDCKHQFKYFGEQVHTDRIKRELPIAVFRHVDQNRLHS